MSIDTDESRNLYSGNKSVGYKAADKHTNLLTIHTVRPSKENSAEPTIVMPEKSNNARNDIFPSVSPATRRAITKWISIAIGFISFVATITGKSGEGLAQTFLAMYRWITYCIFTLGFGFVLFVISAGLCILIPHLVAPERTRSFLDGHSDWPWLGLSAGGIALFTGAIIYYDFGSGAVSSTEMTEHLHFCGFGVPMLAGCMLLSALFGDSDGTPKS